MPPDAVHVDEPQDVGLLLHVGTGPVDDPAVRAPPHRLVGYGEALEHLFVEPVPAKQEVLHLGQELAALGSLDDPVVVRAGHAHNLAHAKLGERGRIGALIFGWIVHATGGHDQALPGHQPRNRQLGPDRARVRQRDRRPGEVVRGELVRTHPPDDVLVGRPEPGEVHPIRSLDVGDEERATPVFLLHVHG